MKKNKCSQLLLILLIHFNLLGCIHLPLLENRNNKDLNKYSDSTPSNEDSNEDLDSTPSRRVKKHSFHITLDDAKEVVNKAIPKKGYTEKQHLETQAEFESRMNKSNMQGKSFTLAVSPEIYSHSNSYKYLVGLEKIYERFSSYPSYMFPIRLASEKISESNEMKSNAFGVTKEVHSTLYYRYSIDIVNFHNIPSSMLYDHIVMKNYESEHGYTLLKDVGLIAFQLQGEEHRNALRESKYGIALKGKIVNLEDAKEEYSGSSATIDSPMESTHYSKIVPFYLEEIYLYNKDTNQVFAGIGIYKNIKDNNSLDKEKSPSSIYYVNVNQESYGPYTIDQINDMLRNKRLSRNDYIWTEGMSEWKKLSNYMKR